MTKFFAILGGTSKLVLVPHPPSFACVHADMEKSLSKLVAETVVRNANKKGLPVAIYRPGILRSLY
jgi:hypothetical protein